MTTFSSRLVVLFSATALVASVVASEAQPRKSTDMLPSTQVKELVSNAKTPADHLKLSKHFSALAAKYETEAAEHAEEARAYRKNPTFMESKNPGGPRTAAHCDRFADLMRQAAKEARELATAHEHMATAK